MGDGKQRNLFPLSNQYIRVPHSSPVDTLQEQSFTQKKKINMGRHQVVKKKIVGHVKVMGKTKLFLALF